MSRSPLLYGLGVQFSKKLCYNGYLSLRETAAKSKVSKATAAPFASGGLLTHSLPASRLNSGSVCRSMGVHSFMCYDYQSSHCLYTSFLSTVGSFNLVQNRGSYVLQDWDARGECAPTFLPHLGLLV